MKQGIVAIMNVVILGAILVVVGVAATLSSINQGQMSLSQIKGDRVTGLVESCIEESLYKINTASTLPPTIITVLGNCTATVNSKVGTSWDFTVTGSADNWTKSANLKINSNGTVSVGSWQDQ